MLAFKFDFVELKVREFFFSPQITQITLILSAGGLAITQIGYAELKVLS